eukprot:1835753-Amphidinium_carterae.1
MEGYGATDARNAGLHASSRLFHVLQLGGLRQRRVTMRKMKKKSIAKGRKLTAARGTTVAKEINYYNCCETSILGKHPKPPKK